MTEQLRDIHLPSAISWWPPAIGWWILVVLFVIAAVMAYIALRRVFQPTLKKQALKLIVEIEKEYASHRNASLCLSHLSAALRRVSISLDHAVAGLAGIAWLEHLDKKLPNAEFSRGVGQIFLTGPYKQKTSEDKIPQVIDLCKRWVESI